MSTETALPDPKRGEVWLVNLDPTVGAEIQKTRPAVVLSSNVYGGAPLRLVAPLTAWKSRYEDRLVHIQVQPSHANGLTKTSAVDVLQLRGLSVARFRRRLGALSAANMEEIVATVAVVIEYR